MDRYAAGDESAFEEVYDLLAPRLYGYLVRHAGSRERAEDIVQHTFEKIHRARGTFIGGAPVLPWAYAIARRLMIDGFRRDRNEPPLPESAADEEALPCPGAGERAASPDEIVQARQTARTIERQLARLPESQRTAFELVKQEELSLAEAATVLGTTVTAVKLRLHRAYESLRTALGEDFTFDGDDS